MIVIYTATSGKRYQMELVESNPTFSTIKVSQEFADDLNPSVIEYGNKPWKVGDELKVTSDLIHYKKPASLPEH